MYRILGERYGEKLLITKVNGRSWDGKLIGRVAATSSVVRGPSGD